MSKLPLRFAPGYQRRLPSGPNRFRAMAPKAQPGRPYNIGERWSVLPAWLQGPLVAVPGVIGLFSLFMWFKT
ncbi:MAG: hypothetical protein INF43_02445 [Alphaproteobacteria bacterium]|nr:hypothetical protein [Alphaproteobacteria bacterium]